MWTKIFATGLTVHRRPCGRGLGWAAMAKLLKRLAAEGLVAVLMFIAFFAAGIHLVLPGGPFVGWLAPYALSPQHLQQAYGLKGLVDSSQCNGGGCDGRNQVVALIENGDFSMEDVATFSARWHLQPAQVTVSKWNAVDHQFQAADAASEQTMGNAEAVMDIDAVHAVAPGAAIHVYEFPKHSPGLVEFGTFLDAALASPKNEGVFSVSEGGCEDQLSPAELALLDLKLKALAGLGKTVLVGSGDDGKRCPDGTPSIGVLYPASEPYVTAVGGTSLYVGPGGSYSHETAWDTGRRGETSGASGGGVSSAFGKPAWQAGISPSAGGRMVPDVAAMADPRAYSLMFEDTRSWWGRWIEDWATGGGTSLSAPLWAGFAAVYNQYAVTHGGEALGFANPAIYYLGEHPNQLAVGALRDVTLNPKTTVDLAAPATVGWDAATGWGSFNAAAFVHDRLDAKLSIRVAGTEQGGGVMAMASGFPPSDAVTFGASGGASCISKADSQGRAQCSLRVTTGDAAGGSIAFEASDDLALLYAKASLRTSALG